MRHTQEQLRDVCAHFQCPGDWIEGVPYGTGHINDTYRVRWRTDGGGGFTILQRINHAVFKNPPQLMENILRVTRHLQQRLPTPGARRETMTVIPSREGRSHYRDDGGHFWRMYVFITNARSVDVCAGPGQAYEAAKAFGRFQADLVNLPGNRLHDTIPFFHHTPRRLAALEDAVRHDPANRAAGVRREIEFCLARRPLAALIAGLVESGRLPERITHNDTKINNVMLDNDTGQGVCVIDLDTVMSGCALYDFGDMARTLPRTVPEDEQDLSKVVCDLAIFDALARGYLESARSFLTPLETEHLALAGRVITFTIGIRFLTDHLLGDVYFKIHRPNHNLERARVQFRMVESMEQQADALDALVRKYA